jgi:hypothetical protein
MATRNTYYPVRIGDQIVWLRNFRNKIGTYEQPLAYSAAEIASVVADTDRCIYLLDTVQGAAQSFAQSITTHIDLVQNGTGTDLLALPSFTLPATPAAPANVLPGALKRLFAFIANMKTRKGFSDDIGEALQVLPATTPDDPNAVPPCDAEARSGEVVVTFKKLGRLGVWIEGQTGNETEWSFLAIDTSNPYNDTRPLKVAGQPEKRRYRLCFWDGEPTKVWTAVLEVVFGG